MLAGVGGRPLLLPMSIESFAASFPHNYTIALNKGEGPRHRYEIRHSSYEFDEIAPNRRHLTYELAYK